MKKPWIAFFSQTGSEIVELARFLGKWPDIVISNSRPDHLRTINPELKGKVVFVDNGHPGLITVYPELKGKDPQMKAFEGKYPVMGCVLHKVVAGVDEGKVIAEERFNAFQISEEEMWKVTRDRSLFLWLNFLRELVA